MTVFGKCGIARIHSISTPVAHTRDRLAICHVNANVHVMSYRMISYDSFCIKNKALCLDIERPCASDAKYMLPVATLTFINWPRDYQHLDTSFSPCHVLDEEAAILQAAC
jgi:hypothetical protein